MTRPGDGVVNYCKNRTSWLSSSYFQSQIFEFEYFKRLYNVIIIIFFFSKSSTPHFWRVHCENMLEDFGFGEPLMVQISYSSGRKRFAEVFVRSFVRSDVTNLPSGGGGLFSSHCFPIYSLIIWKLLLEIVVFPLIYRWIEIVFKNKIHSLRDDSENRYKTKISLALLLVYICLQFNANN